MTTLTTDNRKKLIGINVDAFDCIVATGDDLSRILGIMSAAHCGYFRLTASPRMVTNQDGSWHTSNINVLAQCISTAKALGMKVLMIFNGAGWDSSDWNVPPNHTTWLTALSHLVTTFPQVDAWEIWNEPNTKRAWTGTAADYVSLLKAAYKVVKTANPNALVLFGGTAHIDMQWITDCYSAGCKGSFDRMNLHPYPRIKDNTDVAQILGETAKVRKLMIAHADAKPIWYTELAWSRASVGASGQAQVLKAAYNYVLKNLDYVDKVFWFEAKTQDPTATPDTWQGGLSLLKPDYSVTQAYTALKGWAAA